MSMRAQALRAFGGVDGFGAIALPRPVAGPGQLLVRQVASSVNPADTKIRQHGGALAPELPAVLGMDVAGVVEAVGEGVAGFAAGDAVFGCAGGVRGLPGAYAEYIAGDARLFAHAPKRIALRDSAALPLVAITAWEGLFDRARLAPGQSVLVHGGTGGVGHVAVQLAKAHGARVATTVSSPEKAGLARELGADHTIDYRREKVDDYVARITAGRGFDLVFDATGGRDLATSFAAARLNGQVVTIVSRYEADLSTMHYRGLSLHVVFMLIPMLHDLGRARHGEILREIAARVDDGRLRPLIDARRFPLAQVGAAHAHLESGRALGKVLVDIAAA